MLPRRHIQFIKGLKDKEQRQESGLFSAEGEKLVNDLLQSGLEIVHLYHLPGIRFGRKLPIAPEAITANEMDRITAFKTASPVCGIFKIPEQLPLSPVDVATQWIIALDGISDPGNMGSILRTADWFGIRHCICSGDTVDAFNPKCVQSSMGSVARVAVHYTSLPGFLKNVPQSVSILGADMTGKPVYEFQTTQSGILVMGSEGAGLRKEVREQIRQFVSIPPAPASGQPGPESLNVAVAAAILISHIAGKQSRNPNVN